jgi:hypothetical protein
MRGHCPLRTAWFAWQIRRASDSINPIVSSATAAELAPGVFVTTIPHWVAAIDKNHSTSMPK